MEPDFMLTDEEIELIREVFTAFEESGDYGKSRGDELDIIWNKIRLAKDPNYLP